MVRLGAGGLDGRSLTPTAMTAALQTLAKFRRLAAIPQGRRDPGAAPPRRHAKPTTAATSSPRSSARRASAIRVISGTEEARLIHLAAGYGVNIGGTRRSSSTSAAAASRSRSERPRTSRRRKASSSASSASPSASCAATRCRNHDERRLVKHINKTIGALPRRTSPDAASSASSARRARSSAWARSRSAKMRASRREELRNQRVPAKTIRRIRKRLTSRSISTTRLHMPGLDPRRADIAVAGSVLLDAILRRLGAEGHHALRSRAARRAGPRLRPPQHARRIRRSSAIPTSVGAASSSSASAAATGRSTRGTSRRSRCRIFDQTRAVHRLGDREREWLEYGALLHDVGVHISYERHHRHSYYLIKNGDLRGFDPEEIEIIALLARYHRQATPKKSHEGYGAAEGLAAPDGPDAGRDGAAGRRARPQPRAGAGRCRRLPARRRLSRPPAHVRRRGAGAVGRAPPRGAARGRPGAPAALRGRRAGVQGTVTAC